MFSLHDFSYLSYMSLIGKKALWSRILKILNDNNRKNLPDRVQKNCFEENTYS